MGKALQRGIESLITRKTTPVREVPVSDIKPNPKQPRRELKEKEIESLASSIKEKGLLQPLVVAERGDDLVLVAGQRRLLAVKKLGWKRVPAKVVKVEDETELLLLALVENLQREDLNPVEEAEGFKSLVESGMSHEEVAKLVGKSRSYVSNSIRLLSLPEEVLEYIRRGELPSGSARALVGLPPAEAVKVAKRAVEEMLTVREVEALVKLRKVEGSKKTKKRAAKTRLKGEEEKIREKLGFGKVEVRRGRGGVVVVFKFREEEFEKFLKVL